MSTWKLLARMPDRSIGGLLAGWSLDLTLRFNEVGSWRLTVPREATPSGWPAPGAGLIIMRDTKVVASGMIDEEEFTWSAEGASDASGAGMYTLTGDTDLGRLAYRVVYPTPFSPWSSTQASHFTAVDTAENLLRKLVNEQAGPSALPSRRVPGLVLGPVAGVGREMQTKERFTPLLDAMRSIALSGGGLAFDVRDRLDGNMEFVVWQPTDKSNIAQFGTAIGNVTELQVRRVAPVATVALVAGDEQGENRKRLELADESADPAWGRRELFIDQRHTDDLDEYRKAAEEALATNGEQTAISAVTVDSPAARWGVDFDLGDRVTVVTRYGPITDLVREVNITVDETGLENISSVVGSTNPEVDDPLAATVRAISRRISQLERAL